LKSESSLLDQGAKELKPAILARRIFEKDAPQPGMLACIPLILKGQLQK
jgi:hypothetical protein